MPNTDLVYRFLGIDAGAGAQFDRMAGKTAALGKASNTALGSIKRLTLAGAGVAAVLGVESVKAASNFQTQLTRIHTQADASNATVARLRKGILDMTTTVATAPTQLAQAAFHIASVGQKSLSTAQQLRILKIAAEGAKLGGADLVDVTNALDAAVASGIHGVKNYSQAMGVLNATVGAGDMTMQNLADAFGPLAQVLKNYNINIRQAGAALATFGDLNLRGAEAGTALRMAVQALAVPVKSGQEQLKAWGIQSGNLAKQLQHGGLTEALDVLARKMKENGVTSKNVGDVLTQVFGKRAGVGLSDLIGQLDRFHNKLNEVSKGSKGFASSWKGYTKTFQYAWDSMRDAVQRMAIQLGTKLLPVATKVANWVTHHTKALIVAVSAWAAFKVATVLATVAMAAFDTAADANPVGAIVLALEAVTAGLIYAWTKFKGFRDFVKTAFVDLATVVGKWAQMNLMSLKYVADAMLTFVGTIIHAAASAFGWIPGIGGKLKGAAQAFDGFKTDVIGTLSSLATDAGNLGAYAGDLFASNFISRADQFKAAAQYYVKPGEFASLNKHPKSSSSSFSLGGGAGVNIPSPSAAGSGGGGGGAASAAASSLHVTAQRLVKALADGLLKGWQGFSQTVEDSLSTGTRHLLDALSKQFASIQARMTKLVQDARTNLKNALASERQFVQQMMGDAALSNVPTVDSGFTGQTSRLSNISVFLAGQARSYAQFNRALRRLAHMGLSKSLLNQIAGMGPTQGLQYAQQIIAGQAGSIAQLNAYQKQISTSAQAIGQDRYGAQVKADRQHLERMVREQRQTNRYLSSLARQTGREVAKELGPLLASGLTGKQTGLTPHEAREIERALRKYERQLAKQ